MPAASSSRRRRSTGFAEMMRADLPLAHERGRVSAGRCIGEQEGDVLGANVAAVDPIGRAGTPLDPPGDLAFAGSAVVALVPFEQDRHFGEVARWSQSRFRRRSRRPFRRREATWGSIRPWSSGWPRGGSIFRSRSARRRQ